MNMPRWIFTLNFTLGMFWLLGLLLELIRQEEPLILYISILSLFITIIFSFCLFKLSPNFLKTYPESYISLTKYYILSIIASYFLLVPFFALVAYLFVIIFDNINRHEYGIVIGLLAIWFPLWWFIPVGLTIGWLFYKRKCTLSHAAGNDA